MAIWPRNPAADNAGSWHAAFGALGGNLLGSTLTSNLLPRPMVHRDALVYAVGTTGMVGGVLLATPAGQRLGAILGALGGLAASFGIAYAPGPSLPWLRIPLGLLAIPAGAFVGARLAR